MIKIGMFIDGEFLNHVSLHYRHDPKFKRYISIKKLKEFVQKQYQDISNCSDRTRIVDAHYFRGRYSAEESRDNERLYNERRMDEELSDSGIITHYHPIIRGREKGVDVHFALTAYEHAVDKKLDVVIVITGDGDYVPLIEKLNNLGVDTMVVGWTWFNNAEPQKTICTSQDLLNSAIYHLRVSEMENPEIF